MIAFGKGESETAAERLTELTDEFPDHAPALSDLGLVLTRLDRFSEAEKVLVRAINLLPGVAGFHLNLANVYKGMSMLADAEEHARAAIHHRHDYAEAYRLLSEILSEDGRTDEAEEMARRANQLSPNDPRSLYRLAEALNAANDVPGARAAYERAIELFPDLLMQTSFAQFLAERGFVEESIDMTRALLAIHPDSPKLHLVLARAITFKSHDDMMARMQDLLASDDLDEEGRADLHFALAKAYEDIKDYRRSFDHALKGNALARNWKHYSRQSNEKGFENARRGFSATLISRLGDVGFMDDTPIFVMGMPRSGTTLTEQILASHDDVFGAGELSVLKVLVADMRWRLGVRNDVDLVAKARPEDWRAFGEAYVAHLRRKAPDARHIVDKMPENFRYLGFIRLALPRAKVIYCRRSAPDNCISIFNIQFGASGMGYAYDLGELGDFYRQHVALMAHWQDAMPGFIFTNRYEELVADPEPRIREMLDFCGLAWSDKVLDFYTNTRSVRTASVLQVRQPINKKSIGRYKRYGDAVQPLLDALDWDEEKGEIRP